MSNDALLISSVLYTEGTDKINKKISKEAEKVDPEEAEAEQIIKENISEESINTEGDG